MTYVSPRKDYAALTRRLEAAIEKTLHGMTVEERRRVTFLSVRAYDRLEESTENKKAA